MSIKVKVSTLPSQGLKIKDTMDLAALNDRLNLGRDNDIVFVVAPELDLHISKSAAGANSKGTIRTCYKQPCGLCLDNIERKLELDANFIFSPIPDDESLINYDDAGTFYYKEDLIDLEDVMQESLILALSPFWQAPKDKQGNCSICGKRPVEGFIEEGPQANNLGLLLKRAGIKSEN